MKIEEIDGKAIFVIKLDECQVVKGQRVERTNLTLMSRALKQKSLEGDIEDENEENTFHTKQRKQEYYGVQSEKCSQRGTYGGRQHGHFPTRTIIF